MSVCLDIYVCVCMHPHVQATEVSVGKRQAVASWRKRRGTWQAEASVPLREMPQTYFSLGCLGRQGFMGPPSPTMILVALNCVSPLTDAVTALPVGRLPAAWAPSGAWPSGVLCLTLGSHRDLGRERWGEGVPALKPRNWSQIGATPTPCATCPMSPEVLKGGEACPKSQRPLSEARGTLKILSRCPHFTGGKPRSRETKPCASSLWHSPLALGFQRALPAHPQIREGTVPTEPELPCPQGPRGSWSAQGHISATSLLQLYFLLHHWSPQLLCTWGKERGKIF